MIDENLAFLYDILRSVDSNRTRVEIGAALMDAASLCPRRHIRLLRSVELWRDLGWRGNGDRILAMWIEEDRTIYLSDRAPPRALVHEVGHAVYSSLPPPTLLRLTTLDISSEVFASIYSASLTPSERDPTLFDLLVELSIIEPLEIPGGKL